MAARPATSSPSRLCRGHHRELHRYGDEAAWWEKSGIDPLPAARVLWLKTRPLPAGAGLMATHVPIGGNPTEPDRARQGRAASKPRHNNETKPIRAGERGHDLVRQWQANRRNAGKSTGPITPEGKERSRRNAVRHGLTAETVIGALEDAEDYKAFEAAIIADYDAQSAVERELVLRLASALWRLRRATAMETGLFEIEADHLTAGSGATAAAAVARRSLCLVQIGCPRDGDDAASTPNPNAKIFRCKPQRGTCSGSQALSGAMLFTSSQSAHLPARPAQPI